MKPRMVLSAIFNGRNVLLGAASFFAMGVVTLGPDSMTAEQAMAIMTLVPVGVVAASSVQMLMSNKFHERFNRKEKVRRIKALNAESVKLAYEAKKVTNKAFYDRLKKVMDDRNTIVTAFLKGEQSYLKEKIVEQSLNLVISYVKLMTNFCIRSRDMVGKDTAELINRINMNTRRLSFEKDAYKTEDISRAIEMDERMVERIKEEKQELDRITYKLDYMESSISMLKTELFTSVASDEMLEKLEIAVNEAQALDNVLEDRRKTARRQRF